MIRHLLVAVHLATLAACSGTAMRPDPGRSDSYTDVAEIEFYLSPDSRGCGVTVIIQNRSNIVKGPANLELQWLSHDNEVLATSSMLMDPTRIDRYSGKNDFLPQVDCGTVGFVRVADAEWIEYNDGQFSGAPRHKISKIRGQTYSLSWQPEKMAFYASNV